VGWGRHARGERGEKKGRGGLNRCCQGKEAKQGGGTSTGKDHVKNWKVGKSGI